LKKIAQFGNLKHILCEQNKIITYLGNYKNTFNITRN
jgi:hypothetical protein